MHKDNMGSFPLSMATLTSMLTNVVILGAGAAVACDKGEAAAATHHHFGRIDA